mgnify:CR=1 FL=1
MATRLDLSANGKAQAWIPLPSVREDEWIKPGKNSWETNAVSAEVVRDLIDRQEASAPDDDAAVEADDDAQEAR